MTEKPSKLYYSISEVAALTRVKAHVLRYWESEFPTLRPRKTRSGSRRYRQRDIDEILAIKRLLYDEGYKIAGARKVRRQEITAAKQAEETAEAQLKIRFGDLEPAKQLDHIRSELNEIHNLLRHLEAEAKG